MAGEDGELRAFYNVCRHRAHELLEGSGNVPGVINCPYHAWTYEKDGTLRGARNAACRPSFKKSDFGLREIRLEDFCGFIFINLDENADSLNVLAGDLAEDMRARIPYLDKLVKPEPDRFGDPAINAGWKVVIDNYVECYHCQHAHPAFVSIICMEDYEVDVFDCWSRQIGKNIRLKNDAYALDPDEGFQGAAFWYLWPNTTFNILPGDTEISAFVVRPTSPTTASFAGHTFPAEGGNPNTERRDYLAKVLAPEDQALCESVQRGLYSLGYDQGPIIADQTSLGHGEQAIHHFHRLVQHALVGEG